MFQYRYEPEQIFNNPTPKLNDYFGHVVALEGNKAAIFQNSYQKEDVSEVYLMDTNTGEVLHHIPLKGKCPGHQTISMILNGNRLLVPAPPNLTYYTEASLYDASTGEILQTFSTKKFEVSNFCNSMAMDGDNVVLQGVKTGLTKEYNLYVFSAITGSLMNTININTLVDAKPSENAYCHTGLAIDGDKILVVVGYDRQSKGYLVKTTGELLQTFVLPTEADVPFGNLFVMSGDYVVIGDNNYNNSYGVTFYSYRASTGDLERTFSNPIPYGYSFFGQSLAINGNSLLIGDTGGSNAPNGGGTVYHFDISTGEIIESFTSPFLPSGENYDGFRYVNCVGALNSIAIDENYALIGAYGRKDDNSDLTGVGQVYLYSLGSKGTDGGTDETSYQIQNPSGLVLTVSVNVDYDNGDVLAASNLRLASQKWTISEDGVIKTHLGDFALDMFRFPSAFYDEQHQSVGVRAIDPNSPTQKWKIAADGQLTNKGNGFVVVILELPDYYPGLYFVDAVHPERKPELNDIFILHESTLQFIEI